MATHLHSLFEHSARMTLISPSLASKLKLGVWKEFERTATSALETALQLTDACLDQDRNEVGDVCIVALLQEQKVARKDIQRIVADLFLAAADTVRRNFNPLYANNTNCFTFADLAYSTVGPVSSCHAPRSAGKSRCRNFQRK